MFKALFLHIAAIGLVMSIFSCDQDENTINEAEFYIEIPDENFEAKLIAQGIDSDTIINQKILKTDAESVTRLILDLSKDTVITDLTGIEGFVNLTFLSAFQNDIAVVDLSNNLQLDTLYLTANLLTELDLSKNKNLSFVNLESNALTSITGLSNTSALKNVQVSFNYLEELDVSNSTVERLFASDNDLISLDVTDSKNLKNIFLKTNQLATVNLTTNTQLETLVLSDNKFQTLALEKNSLLEYLFVSSNSLIDLDVSVLPSLVHLTIHNNPNLTCIGIAADQDIPTVTKTEDQKLSEVCQ